LESFQPKLEPTKPKLADDSSTSTRLDTSVFHSSWARVATERVKLKLGLVSDLRRKGLVSCDVEVRSADDFVCVCAFACFYVTENANLRHSKS